VTGWHAQVHNDPSLMLGYSDSSENPTLQAGFTYYGQVFSHLLDRMDSVMEANGKTMLDNSLAIWISEFGDGRVHSGANLPVVIAGSAQGKIVTNRHLVRNTATTGDLWTTVLNAFGVPATSFGYNGSAGLNNGPIAGILT
jgi:muramoyltetrapeptide carboxypeptidase LdcA involved in peptidoglycan recycling